MKTKPQAKSWKRPDLERQGFFLVSESDGFSSVYIGYRCPACQGVHPDSPSLSGTGHKPDCWLDKILKGAA